MLKEFDQYIETLKIDKSPYTVTSYAAVTKRFLDFFGIETAEQLDKITPQNVREYQAHLQKEGLSNGSINTHCRQLKTFFNTMKDEFECISLNPFVKIKALKANDTVAARAENLKYMTFEEQEMLIEFCRTKKNKRDLAMILLMLRAGLRRAEIVNLKVSDFNGEDLFVLGKGNKRRKLFMNEETKAVIADVIAKREKYYGEGAKKYDNMFLSSYKKPFSMANLNSKIPNLCRMAGIDPERAKEITPHVLRHTFATNMVTAGIDMEVIQRGLGHASLSTTAIYAHVRDDVLRKAMTSASAISSERNLNDQ